MTSEPRSPEPQEQYTHGYNEASQVMAKRSASAQASFLLPHLKPGMSLLDCGCGPGTMTMGLAEVVAPGEVVGIDIESGEIERAKANAQEGGVTNVDWRVASAYEIPFPDASFNAVFSHTLLEHLSEPEKAVREMYRVLKPSGVIGLRDSDWGGYLMAPHYPILEKWIG